jgi:hypothetical protein
MTEEIIDQGNKDLEEEEVSDDEVSVELDKGIASYELVMSGQILGTYTGKFSFRCAVTPMQFLEADRDYRELLGRNGELASTHADSIAYSLAHLRQRIVEAPPFWNEFGSKFGGAHIKDHEVVDRILKVSVVAENKYRKLLNDKHSAAINKLKAHVDKIKKANQSTINAEQESLDSNE